MKNANTSKIFNYCIAIVWLLNGLVCKVLGFVPRHQEIVGRILGNDYSRPIVLLIGLAEILMAIWILTGYRSRFNAIVQIVIVLLMNLIEFILAKDLLLWGMFNFIFAALFTMVVYYNEFFIKKNL